MNPFDLPDAQLRYHSQFFSPEEADNFYEHLLDTLAWEQKPIRIFGKELMQPRLVAWYGDSGISYSYSGIRLEALPWDPILWKIKEQVEASVGNTFNSVLCNLYRDGKDSMGWHADDEPELGPEPCIASVSLGAERYFHLKHKSNKELPTTKILLEHGSLLLMHGPTQTHYKHQLPKTRKVPTPRINLTFRQIYT